MANNGNATAIYGLGIGDIAQLVGRRPCNWVVANIISHRALNQSCSRCGYESTMRNMRVERLQFGIHWSGETILPESNGAIEGRLTEAGLIFHLLKDVPALISRNTLPIYYDAIGVAGSPSWNDLFWCVHPGGRAILDEVAKTLSLKPEKLEATREILYNYGNMSGASVLFVLDQMRRRSAQTKRSTTGEGCEWGLVVGFGPGLAVEVAVQKAIATCH